MSTETLQDDIIMTVFCSQGKNNFPITIKRGLFWGDVRKIVKEHGYNVDSMKAIESTRKGVLEHPKAVIPNENFRLHLYPVKSKGGAKKEKAPALNRKEIVEKVKKNILIYGDKAKNFFSADKSYTNTTTEELNVSLTKWEKKYGSTPEGEVASTPKKKVKNKISEEKSETADEVASSLAEKAKETVAHTPTMAMKTCIHLLRSISSHENQTHIEQAITLLEKALIVKPTPSEQELIDAEHRELASGLENIVR